MAVPETTLDRESQTDRRCIDRLDFQAHACNLSERPFELVRLTHISIVSNRVVHKARMVPGCHGIGKNDHVVAILSNPSVAIVVDVWIRRWISGSSDYAYS